MQALTSARVLAQYRGLWLVASETEEPRLVPARGRLTRDAGHRRLGRARRRRRDRRHQAAPRRDRPPRPGRGDRRPGAGRQRRPRARHRAAAGAERPPARALRRARGLRRRARRARADQGRPRRRRLPHRGRSWRGGWASPTRSRSARSPARASAPCASCCIPGTTAVLLGASGTGKSTLVNALLGEERQATGEVRADGRGRHTTVTRELLTLPGGAFLIDTPGIRDRRPLGRHRRELRRRRRARPAVPLRGLRPRHRAGLRGPREPRPRADRGLAQAAARAGLDRGPPRREPGPRSERPGDLTAAAEAQKMMRAGEGNRTPIFGLGSQRLSHWTTPARVGSVTDADTLADVRLRVFWPVTLVAAALVGLLAYGVVSKGTNTTLDDAVAKGKRPQAPAGRAAVAAADRQRLAGGLQGQGRRAERLGLVVRPVPRGDAAAAEDAREDRSPRAASCSASTRRTPATRRSPSSRSARRRSRACATATASTGARSA